MAVIDFGAAKFCEECGSKFSDGKVCPVCKDKGFPKESKPEVKVEGRGR